MSIYGAMFSGVSGLAAQSQTLGAIADNISNVNTVGYKSTTLRFSTLVTQQPTTNSYAPGGVRAAPLTHVDRQGLLQSSVSPTDLAITGKGFFVVNEAAAAGIGNEYLFTRAGSFTQDKDGNLVNAAGLYLQGWQLDANGALPTNTSSLTALKTVNTSNLSALAKRTTTITIGANLPATATVGQTETTNMLIYDSLGVPHNLELTWRYDGVVGGNDQWSIRATGLTRASDGVASGTYDPDTGSGGAAAALSSSNFMSIGTISFANDGTPTGGTGAITRTLDFTPSSPQQFNFTGSGGELGVTGSGQISIALGTYGQADSMTFLDGPYTPKLIDQNGLQFGSFAGLDIGENGTVTALFDNGERRDIFKLPMATFNNPNGLGARTGNAYVQSSLSGDVLMLQPNTGGAGKISSGSLEASTVDLAEEFTNMIVTQRAYSAAARVITTGNDMLEELIRIKR